jgi:hypothetical protein
MKQDQQKPKADRLLKQLPLKDRKRQQEIRQLIQNDPLFKVS